MSTPEKKDKITLALAGSPNCGKTSLFNGLTGMRQHVGNYPGVTVEKRTGYYKFNNKEVEVRDLPGSYSLSSFSPEEMIAQKELVEDRPDVVVVVVDATALKRSMVLLAQVMLNSSKIVLCLNMSDEAKKSGQRIDLPLLEKLLGFPVVETVAHKQVGLDKLKEKIDSVSQRPFEKSRLMLGERLEAALKEIAGHLEFIQPQTRLWHAIKLLQGDELYIKKIKTYKDGNNAVMAANQAKVRIETLVDDDISMFITERYYGFVDGLLRETMLQVSHIDTRIISDRIDQVVVHKIVGIPIFLAVMYAIFWMTFSLGTYPMEWIEKGFEVLSLSIASLWPQGYAQILKSLITEGIIGGVGGVLVFLPNIVILFTALAFLQDSGYMSRAAFLTDRLMHKFGLHGRSFIPMVTGFGCTIPGIMATRTMENQRDRLTTMMVLPLMSCGARLPIWLLLIPAFFSPAAQAPMLFAIYAIGIMLAFILSLLIRKSLLKGEEAPFVMELPPYRMPTLRSVLARMMSSSWLYVKKAGTIILAISIIMWFLTTYPRYDMASEETQRAQSFEQLEYSYAGRIGKTIEPVIKPLGFDWKIGVASLGAFAAKEVFVSQMAVIYSVQNSEDPNFSLREALRNDYSPLVGFSLMIFLLVATPCMATLAITRKESGHWKWPLIQFSGLTILAYLLSLIIYQIGSLFL